MFRFAEKKDKKSLAELWFKCFGDGEEFVMPFLDAFLKDDNAYIFENDGKAVSAVYALDCKIGFRDAVYFYAVATDENFRRRGLAKKEIEFLIKSGIEKGKEIFLLTASSEKNRKYYESLGFRDFFFCKKHEFKLLDKKSKISESFDSKELLELRNEVLSKNGFVSFPQNHIDFALKFSDGVFTEKENGKTVSYAIINGKKITEFCSKNSEESFASAVLEKIGESSASVYMPLREDGTDGSCKISRGMIYCFDEELKKALGENVFLSLNLE